MDIKDLCVGFFVVSVFAAAILVFIDIHHVDFFNDEDRD